MNKSLGVLLLCICTSAIKGQDSVSRDTLKARYENMTLHFINGHISKGLDDSRISRSELADEFSFSSEGASAYQIYTRKKTTSVAFLAISLAGFAASYFTHDNNRDLSKVFLGVGIISYTISIPFIIKAHKKLHYAVWVRNRDLLLR